MENTAPVVSERKDRLAGRESHFTATRRDCAGSIRRSARFYVWSWGEIADPSFGCRPCEPVGLP